MDIFQNITSCTWASLFALLLKEIPCGWKLFLRVTEWRREEVSVNLPADFAMMSLSDSFCWLLGDWG